MWSARLKRRKTPAILHYVKIQKAAIMRSNRINFAEIEQTEVTWLFAYTVYNSSFTNTAK